LNVKRNWKSCGLILMLLLSAHPAPGQDASPSQDPSHSPAWRAWSEDVFAEAAREHKLVLLDLVAPWCRWCQVMEAQSYNDPAVRKLIEAGYVAVRVDQNAQPDIANRYRQLALPVTVIYDADGNEIVRKQGFLRSQQIGALLQAVIDDPSPGPSATEDAAPVYSESPVLAPGLLAELKKLFNSQYDIEDKGWAFGVEYIDADRMAYSSAMARQGDASHERRARGTLQAMQALLDPVWGGVHQSLVVAPDFGGRERYVRLQIGGRLDSDGDDWNEPHYEKPLFVQAQALRIYARAYTQWRAPEYLSAAQSVHDYVRRFLTSPEGAFYAGQDAVAKAGDLAAYFAQNDAERRAAGVPPVDRHLYARENGWMISALCALYAVTGDTMARQEAERAARWVMAHRALADGGFSHDKADSTGPYLGDTLAIGQAFLDLYEVTADREWLHRAEASARFIAANFADRSQPGFVTSKIFAARAHQPFPDRRENAELARFASLLAYATDDREIRGMAARAMRYLATSEIATGDFAAPVLLAETQFANAPEHIVIVGDRKDAAAQALYQTALRTGPAHFHLEWPDPSEGAPPRIDLLRPPLNHAAAYRCTASGCAVAASDPLALEQLLKGHSAAN
jgi:uncharacterized protein